MPKRGPGTNGVVALLEAQSDYEPVRSYTKVPWPEPESFAGTIKIRLISELATPVTDRFVNQVSVRFGIENIALIHGFRELDPTVAAKLNQLFIS